MAVEKHVDLSAAPGSLHRLSWQNPGKTADEQFLQWVQCQEIPPEMGPHNDLLQYFPAFRSCIKQT